MNPDYVAKFGPGPHVAVDAMVVSSDKQVLLIRRGDTGELALPGGFVEPGERLLGAALRELQEETGLCFRRSAVKVKVFDDPQRDPRAHIITHAHLFMIDQIADENPVKAADDAKEALWLPMVALFDEERNWFADHAEIVSKMMSG